MTMSWWSCCQSAAKSTNCRSLLLTGRRLIGCTVCPPCLIPFFDPVSCILIGCICDVPKQQHDVSRQHQKLFAIASRFDWGETLKVDLTRKIQIWKKTFIRIILDQSGFCVFTPPPLHQILIWICLHCCCFVLFFCFTHTYTHLARVNLL